MTNRSIVALGLPQSGKTTFLAAFWHVVAAQDVAGGLSLVRMNGDNSHLNDLRDRWSRVEELRYTQIPDEQFPTMLLQSAAGTSDFILEFPDLSGESIRDGLWNRELSESLATVVDGASGILIFVHSERIVTPVTIQEVLPSSGEDDHSEAGEVSADIGRPDSSGPTIKEVIEGSASPAEASQTPSVNPGLLSFNDVPTSIWLVDLLQCIRARRGSAVPRLGVIVSAWDLVTEEMDPADWLKNELGLFWQALEYGDLVEAWSVWGVSAQGGRLPRDAEELRMIDRPTERIKVVRGESSSHDITEPVKWALTSA